ncbi:Acetyltransferase (GNAT) family protein [Clostridium acidisoli DSM 12555]|uniref:Acetyltransferase (GNAT) family protein n=1 Tax=Clostridium acidisoli DSM 12555 TaxID=1121291 RepID=A0A1W1WZ39_9CLOT|nr:GNAT family N-acetyltransferase [Clostridium acidisoli]SMC16992.1 Acetyltransferase (GNAT) family protein [Clostridium acidisoli DSM 12555]
MLSCVNLNNNNINNLKKLNDDRKIFNNINKDFFKFYNDLNFIQKHFRKKLVKLLEDSGKYVGYIWINNDSRKYYRIESLSININEDSVKCFKMLLNSISLKGSFIYECEKNNFNYKVLKEIGFKKIQGTLEMCCNLIGTKHLEIRKDISITKFLSNQDEKIRCYIQNKIFEKDDRIPLSIQDIYFDESQDYYFEDGCYFINIDDKPIGYGQIIVNDSMPIVVNFGILSEYRKNGYGKYFIKFLQNVAVKNGFKEIYIKVDWDNRIAFELYKSVGFKVDKEIYKWKLQR